VGFINELKRRNVFKVGVGYVIVAWLLAQPVTSNRQKSGARNNNCTLRD